MLEEILQRMKRLRKCSTSTWLTHHRSTGVQKSFTKWWKTMSSYAVLRKITSYVVTTNRSGFQECCPRVRRQTKAQPKDMFTNTAAAMKAVRRPTLDLYSLGWTVEFAAIGVKNLLFINNSMSCRSFWIQLQNFVQKYHANVKIKLAEALLIRKLKPHINANFNEMSNFLIFFRY